MTESPVGTIVQSPGAGITDSQGHVWTIANGMVVQDGQPDWNTANVIEIAYEAGPNGPTTWQENSDNNWWAWTPGAGWYGWTQEPAAPFSVVSSKDGTCIGASAAESLTDSAGNVWQINAQGQITVNGVADQTTARVVTLAYVGGRVWQENLDQLWWSKVAPNDSWGAATAKSPLSTVWWGGGNNDGSQNPSCWFPMGIPKLGQTAIINGGTVNVTWNMNGDLLQITSATDPLGHAASAPTINLINTTLKAGGKAGEDVTPTINVSGRSTLDYSAPYASQDDVTVNLAKLSSLVLTDTMTFGKLTVTGAPDCTLIAAGTSTFNGTAVMLETPTLGGSGTLKIGPAQSFRGSLEDTGAIEQGIKLIVDGDAGRTANVGMLTLDNPGLVHGAVTLGWGNILLKASADSYSFKNDMLTLYRGGTTVAQFGLTLGTANNQPLSLRVEEGNGPAAGSTLVSVYNSAAGASDFWQPGGPAVTLPVYQG